MPLKRDAALSDTKEMGPGVKKTGRKIPGQKTNQICGRIFRIQRYSIHDGPGIRTTLFFQGCPLRCQWCHNPESQAETSATAQVLDVGTTLEKIEQDTIFFDHSRGGVTFSGGEPLAQPQFLLALLEECRTREIHTTVDTSGFAPAGVMEKVAALCDLILFDIKVINDIKHQKHTGVSVIPILKNLALLEKRDVAVRLRLPLVPGITTHDDNVNGIIELLAAKKRLKTIDLLPFHRTGEAKYRCLGMENSMQGVPEPDHGLVQSIKEKFLNNGFSASIGG